jgi:hypothetical protein
MMKLSMEVDLDEHCLDSMTSGNKGCIVLNHETLTGKTTHQGAWEVVVPTWHDVDMNSCFF